MIRLKLLEGVPSRSHSTSDTHADSGRAMPIAECTQRRGAGSQTHSRVSTARGAFLIREKATSRVLPQTGLIIKRFASPNSPLFALLMIRMMMLLLLLLPDRSRCEVVLSRSGHIDSSHHHLAA